MLKQREEAEKEQLELMKKHKKKMVEFSRGLIGNWKICGYQSVFGELDLGKHQRKGSSQYLTIEGVCIRCFFHHHHIYLS